jgi:hypothetical protein
VSSPTVILWTNSSWLAHRLFSSFNVSTRCSCGLDSILITGDILCTVLLRTTPTRGNKSCGYSDDHLCRVHALIFSVARSHAQSPVAASALHKQSLVRLRNIQGYMASSEISSWQLGYRSMCLRALLLQLVSLYAHRRLLTRATLRRGLSNPGRDCLYVCLPGPAYQITPRSQTQGLLARDRLRGMTITHGAAIKGHRQVD